jgi:hypothetical protein
MKGTKIMANDKPSGQETPKPDDKKAADAVLDGKKPAETPKDEGKETPAPEGEKKTDDKPAGSKDEGHKDGEGAPKPEVPEKYELQRPDDELWTDDDIQRYSATAKELKLTQQQAEALLARDVAEGDRIRAAFLTELKADKDLGGTKFDATVAAANKGLREFLKENPEAEQDAVIGMLLRSGYTNNKALVRAFARIGRMTDEDQPDAGGKGGGGGGAKTDAELFYGQK